MFSAFHESRKEFQFCQKKMKREICFQGELMTKDDSIIKKSRNLSGRKLFCLKGKISGNV